MSKRPSRSSNETHRELHSELESFKTAIVQRVFRNFLDVMILRIVHAEPMWGYKMIKQVKEHYGVKLRHGALYPTLNTLEKKGLLRSTKETNAGRTRKVYRITLKGTKLVEAYNEFLKEQTPKSNE